MNKWNLSLECKISLIFKITNQYNKPVKEKNHIVTPVNAEKNIASYNIHS